MYGVCCAAVFDLETSATCCHRQKGASLLALVTPSGYTRKLEKTSA